MHIPVLVSYHGISKQLHPLPRFPFGLHHPEAASQPVEKPVPRRAKGRKNSAVKAVNDEASNDANDQEAADDCAGFVDVSIL